MQAVSEVNIPYLFNLYRQPFKWGSTKIRSYIFPEILFGCPNYSLVFALPLTQASKDDTSPPPLIVSLKPQTLTHLLSFLSIKDLLSLSSTNREWRSWIISNDPLWEFLHYENWKIPPCRSLVQSVGWFVVVVLKTQRHRLFQKGFCAKISEFELNLENLLRGFHSHGNLAAQVLLSPMIVLKPEELKDFTSIFLQTSFLENLPTTVSRLHLNNLKHYFKQAQLSNQPMIIFHKSQENHKWT